MTLLSRLKLFAASNLALCLASCAPADQADNDNQPPATIEAIAQALDVKYTILANKHGGQCQALELQPVERETYISDCRAGTCERPVARIVSDKSCMESSISLSAPMDMPPFGWKIYFNQVHPIIHVDEGAFDITHINGDLYSLSPNQSFKGLSENKPHSVSFVSSGLLLTEAQAMANFYITDGEDKPYILQSTRAVNNPVTGLPELPMLSEFIDEERQFRGGLKENMKWAKANVLYEANQETKLQQDAIDYGIIPKPEKIIPYDGDKDVNLSKGISVTSGTVPKKFVEAALAHLDVLGINQNPSGISVKLIPLETEDSAAGSYTLDAKPEGVEIKAIDGEGFANAFYSLAGLFQLGKTTIPSVYIEDTPRFAFRGLHIDLARNFHSKDSLLKVIDQMAAYKLNKLHLHLADDEGWRLEISDLSELTDIGSKRCHDLSERKCLLPFLGSGPNASHSVNGFLTTADYKKLLQYAAMRHIEIIPSLDMPGHSRAAIKSMEARYHHFSAFGEMDKAEEFLLTDFNDETEYRSIQNYNDNTLNVCMESTYNFVEKVVSELQDLHTQAGVPLVRYHIGADETAGAWFESPKCKAFLEANKDVSDIKELGPYFIQHVAKMLDEKGIMIAGWDDGMGHTDPTKIPKNVQSNYWGLFSWEDSKNHKSGIKLAHSRANLGWDIVVSTPEALYFDFPYELDPKEGGYYWGTRQLNTRRVFEFMPENLAAHAEIWTDAYGNDLEISDEIIHDEAGRAVYNPLSKGTRIHGIQAQVWSETVRSQAQLEYQLFPRLLAVSERAWRAAKWEVPYNHSGATYSKLTSNFTAENKVLREKDWQRFASILGEKEMPKLEKFDIFYRLPTIGAVIDAQSTLRANAIFPSLPIQFKDGGNDWQDYSGPVKIKGPVQVRSRSQSGKRLGRALIVN